MVLYKGGACALCGYACCLRALEFHHLSPATKRFSIAGSHTRSWKSLRTELDKCILVCSNCHDEIEAGETIIPDHLVEEVRRATAHIPELSRRRPGRPVTRESS
jgi:hypothetical protein